MLKALLLVNQSIDQPTWIEASGHELEKPSIVEAREITQTVWSRYR